MGGGLTAFGCAVFQLGRADTMNLTQWREGAKGAKIKMRLLRCCSRFLPRRSRSLPPSFPLSTPVIPAKAGIQKARHPKSSTDSSQRIPSPFMGEG